MSAAELYRIAHLEDRVTLLLPHEPSALLAAARAARMPAIDYVLKIVMPARAEALIAKQRADAAARGMAFDVPLFSAKVTWDSRAGR